jgi:predicted RNase H-like nuclease (RuvC/YqgF family)
MLYEKKIMEFVDTAKALNVKLTDFCFTVEKLNGLRKFIEETDLKKIKDEHQSSLTNMGLQLQVNKYKTLEEESKKFGKILVSEQYINSLKNDIAELEEKVSGNLKDEVDQVTKKLQCELSTGMKIQQIECESKINLLNEKLNGKNREILSLKSQIQELKQQINNTPPPLHKYHKDNKDNKDNKEVC